MKYNLLNKIELSYHLPKFSSAGRSFVPVNHICIHKDCIIFNDIVIPYGSKDIEEKSTFVIDEILHNMLHVLMSNENKDKQIIICGEAKAKRMFARKLEDRLKKEINY